jgi:hypothetical protein
MLLMACVVLTLSAQDARRGVGLVTIPYLYGDTGMVAIQAGEVLPVTWEDAPPGAFVYIFLWRSYGTGDLSFMGIDFGDGDSVSIRWKVLENLGGVPFAVALYGDGTSLPSINDASSLIYGSGSAPPEGICSVRVSDTAPEVFANEGGIRILGYMGSYAPALAYVVDSAGFPWIRIDLSQPGVIAPLDPNLALLDTGWIYAHRTQLFGDCGFLGEG